MMGIAVVAAAVVYAGAGSVARGIGSLGVGGLLLLALMHVPIVVMMAVAWWLASGDDPPAAQWRFVWARFVRDAAGELLPFLPLGGAVFGLRALGGASVVAVVSASIDGVIELTAKLPYALAAILTLLPLTSGSRLTQLLWLVFAATCFVVATLLWTRRSLWATLAAIARVVSARWPAAISLCGCGADAAFRGSFARVLGQRGRLWSCFMLHLCCWCLGTAEVWVTFRLLGVDLTWSQALVIDGTVVTLRTFGVVVPGAAGIQEGGYMLSGALFGITPAASITASLARRARDLLLGVGTLGFAAVGKAALSCREVRGAEARAGLAPRRPSHPTDWPGPYTRE